MPRTFRSNHHHVHIIRWNDRLEMNAEAVREPENFSRMQIWLNVLFVNRGLSFIGRQHVDPIGALGGLIRSHHHHAIGARLLRARPARFQPHDYLVAAIAQILRLRMPLAAVAQDGDGFALQRFGLRVVFIKNRRHQVPLSFKGKLGMISVISTDRPVGIGKSYLRLKPPVKRQPAPLANPSPCLLPLRWQSPPELVTMSPDGP